MTDRKGSTQKATPETKQAKVTDQNTDKQELQVEELEERIAPTTASIKPR